MLRATVTDTDPRDPTRVWVTIPQKYGAKPVRVFTRVQVSKGDHVYVTDTSVTRVPQWVVFDLQTEIGLWGNAYPHTHPMGQVDGLVDKLKGLDSNVATASATATTAKTIATRNDTALTVESFGAAGDGVKIDTAAIQAALDNSMRRPVHFTKGRTYLIDAPLYVPSQSRVEGNGATIRGSKALSSVLILEGSPVSTDINTTGTYNAGDAQITTATAHGLTVGETIRMVGQRQIASIDAPTTDRLGMATGNTNGPWNGEYLTVREVTSPTVFTTATGLVFNAYRDNATQETHPQARPRTTINRMAWHENTTVQNLNIEANTSNTIRLSYCKDVTLRNIRDYRAGTSGASIAMIGSYRCRAEQCHAEYKGDRPSSVLYYQRNLYKLVSSQACVVDRCTSDGGGQVVDMTYLQSAKIPTIACQVRDCTFMGFDDNGVTTHPGVWGAIITGNDFRGGNKHGLANGIGIRSPYSMVSGNLLSGVPGVASTDPFLSSGTYGIHLYDGGGHHCTISNNHIVGYDLGIGISDGGHESTAEYHGELHDLITGNQIMDTYFGVILRKSYKADPNIFSAVTIMGNQITSRVDGACGVQTDTGSASTRAPVVSGNTLHFSGTNPVPIRIGKNTKDPVLAGNTVTGTAITLYQTQTGAANGTITTTGNTVVGMTTIQKYDR